MMAEHRQGTWFQRVSDQQSSLYFWCLQGKSIGTNSLRNSRGTINMLKYSKGICQKHFINYSKLLFGDLIFVLHVRVCGLAKEL